MIVFVAVSLLCRAASAQKPVVSVFPYQQADAARQAARDQCKPLTLHFVPNDQLGVAQMSTFYQGTNRIDDDILSEVVIVALPAGKFAKSAAQYGLTAKGGYRTISAYDLDAFERESMGTVRSGFI